MPRTAALVLALALAAPGLLMCEAWSSGRSTFYGADGWSIHIGSCMYGQLDESVSTGWHVAALADVAPDYKGSCGKCKEVKCDARDFTDGYGAWLNRKSVCYNTEASVVVMVVDTCACNYASNAFSNRRWCCGDTYHMDISVWAFEKLADTRWGVIATKWRDVDCNAKPRIAARHPSGAKTAMPDAYKPKAGWSRNMDKRLSMWKGGK